MAVFAAVLGSPVSASADDCPNAQYRKGPSANLPDCRALEMVTPVEKPNGRGVGTAGPTGLTVLMGLPSANGKRIAYSITAGALTPDTGFGYTNDYALSGRTDTGWETRPLMPGKNYARVTIPPTVFEPKASDNLEMFSATTNGAAYLVPDMASWPNGLEGPVGRGFDAAYTRSWENEDFTRIGPGGPSQSASGSFPAGVSVLRTQVSGDGSHTLLMAPIRGMLGATDPSLEQLSGGAGGATLYDYADGETQLVGVCTGSGADRTQLPSSAAGSPSLQSPQPCPDPTAGRSATLTSTRGAVLGGGSITSPASAVGNFAGAVSHDGKRMFFESPDPSATSVPAACTGTGTATSCPPALYVRQLGGDGVPTTRWISRSKVPNQAAALMGKVVYEGASRDGSKVFFRTNAPLTADDPNGTGVAPPSGGIVSGTPSANSWDLYEYDLPTGSDPGNGTLTRITAGPSGSDPNTCVPACTSATLLGQGAALRYASADGNRVYFVTNSPLAGASSHSGTSTVAAGTPAVPGSFANLYLYDATKSGAARWEFIARLPRSTSGLDSCATFGALRGQPRGTSGLAASGSNCVRGSNDGKTITFQTGGALVSGDGDTAQDVYRYDEEKTTNALTVISQSAVAGVGPNVYACVTGALCNADLGTSSLSPDTGLRNVAEDGTVYFESQRRLTSGDANDTYDVYASHVDGGLSLVSPGATNDHAYFSGVSSDGRDVFIETSQPISKADVDREWDIYDARAGGGFADPEVIDPCDPEVDSAKPCTQPPPPPPAVEQPASAGDGIIPSVDPGPLLVSPVITAAKPSAKALGTSATTGKVNLAITVKGGGKLTVAATGRFSGRTRTLATATRTIRGLATVNVNVPLRLNANARAELRRVGTLRMTISVSLPGAKTQKLSVTLKKAKAKKKRSTISGKRGRS